MKHFRTSSYPRVNDTRMISPTWAKNPQVQMVTLFYGRADLPHGEWPSAHLGLIEIIQK